MLTAYTTRLQRKDFGDYRQIYRHALIPPSNENDYQIGKRYNLEALKIFRIHYKENQYSVVMTKCEIAFSLIMQSNVDEADKYEKDCRLSARTFESHSHKKWAKDRFAILDKARKEKDLSLIR